MGISNYSIDFFKKAAFVDEVNNVLKVLEFESPNSVNEEIVAIIEYLENRIKEIDAVYKL